MRAARWAMFTLLVLVSFGVTPATGAPPPEFSWIDEFGSPFSDAAYGIALGPSEEIVVGETDGTLAGPPNAGGSDAFVRKYDAAGTPLWTRQFGTPGDDTGWDVAWDGTGVYVIGGTGGALPGQTWAGGQDAFLRKYDAAGTELWTREFGTAALDWPSAIVLHPTGIYVAGGTYGTLPGQVSAGNQDAFLRKYDTNGNEIWTRQFGTAWWEGIDNARADATGVYVSGNTDGAFPNETSAGNYDIFVRKYDHGGNVLWTDQFGTPASDLGGGMGAEASGIYLSGNVFGTLPGQVSQGASDAFLRKYDTAGTELWTRQFGTLTYDGGTAVVVAGSSVCVAGWTHGSFPGYSNGGDADVFVQAYDTAGTELWTRQFGTPGFDVAYGLAHDGTFAYLAGLATGDLPARASAGGQDAFAMRLGGTPAVSVSPASLAFGAVEIGSNRTMNVTVSSIGTAFAAITDVSLLSGSAGFSLDVPPSVPRYMPQQTSVEIAITFAPPAPGAVTDTLRISTNDPAGGVVDISLSGTGVVVPRIDVTPSSLPVGNVELGNSIAGTVQIRSVGSASLTVTAVSLASGTTGFTMPSPPAVPLSIPPGGSVDVSVRLIPTGVGPATDELRISSDDPSRGLVIVQLGGTGVDTTAPAIAHTPPSARHVGEVIPIEVTVTDLGGIGEVTLYYRGTRDSAFTALTLTRSSGETYTGSIPGQSVPGDVSYYVVARDAAGNVARMPATGENVIQVVESPPGGGTTPLPDLLVPALLIALVAAVLGGAAMVATRRRRRRRAPSEPSPPPR